MSTSNINISAEINAALQQIDFENIGDHPNILIAARLWDDSRYAAATVCYRFMRYIDDMIDHRKEHGSIIECFEKQLMTDKVQQWIDCLGSPSAKGDTFLNEVSATIKHFNIPTACFKQFAKSMIYDINHNGFATFSGFLDYAEGASNGPASVFVHLCCLQQMGSELIPIRYNVMDLARPCAIFSYLVHIIRDFQKDQLGNLNYFADDILQQHGLTPIQLKYIASGAPVSANFRYLIENYCQLAKPYRDQTLAMLGLLQQELEPRYLMSLKVIFALYDMVYQRIDPFKANFTTVELNPTVDELKRKVLEIVCQSE